MSNLCKMEEHIDIRGLNLQYDGTGEGQMRKWMCFTVASWAFVVLLGNLNSAIALPWGPHGSELTLDIPNNPGYTLEPSGTNNAGWAWGHAYDFTGNLDDFIFIFDGSKWYWLKTPDDVICSQIFDINRKKEAIMDCLKESEGKSKYRIIRLDRIGWMVPLPSDGMPNP